MQIHPELTTLINSREAWLFVGSGVSIPAGHPSWGDLARKVLKHIATDEAESIRRSNRYIQALKRGDYPAAFSAIESIVGRPALEGAVRHELRPREVTPLVSMLADWPFAGYITTNYDNLLEQALIEVGHGEPWKVLGNTSAEVKQIGGGATRTVWHVHGSARQQSNRSRLILTKEDYATLYAPGSVALAQLKAVLAVRRLVFVGFGFNDAEVSLVLQAVARQTTPNRPIIAILPSTISDENRHGLITQHNVNVIMYASDGPAHHDQLSNLLNAHDPFILRRSQSFRLPGREVPTFDDEATGLLIFNELTLNNSAGINDDVLKVALKARVLAKISGEDCSLDELSADLLHRAQLIGGPTARPNEDLIQAAVDELIGDGLLELQHEGMVHLLPAGTDLVSQQRSVAEHERELFDDSLFYRAQTLGRAAVPPLREAQIRRIQQIAAGFFKESVEQRVLATAQALYNDLHREFNLVGLLQPLLPRFTGQSQELDEALVLIELIQSVFLKPTAAELRYFGFALQAQFALNLIGFDEPTVRARLRDLADTMFILDAYLLLPYLAVGHKMHDAARTIVEKLRRLGSGVATNWGFVRELSTHTRKAFEKLGAGLNEQSALRAASGEFRTNVFQTGYVNSLIAGRHAPRFGYYINDICRIPSKNGRVSDKAFSEVLADRGIAVMALKDWAGFKERDIDARQELAAQIQKTREPRGTFRGNTQVDAEAEALLVVLQLRNRKYAFGDRRFGDALFVSPTTLVDRFTETNRRVTIGFDVLLHTLAALTAWSVDEMTVLASTLLGQISAGNLLVIDKAQLSRIFSSAVSTSKASREEYLSVHRNLISECWGADEVDRIEEADDLDVPLLMERISTQALDHLKQKLAAAEADLDKRAAKDKLSADERQLFERWRAAKIKKKKKIQARHKSRPTRQGGNISTKGGKKRPKGKPPSRKK